MVERVAPLSALVFYEKKTPTGPGRVLIQTFYGIQARPGYVYQWLRDLNKFSREPVAIPRGYRKRRSPGPRWIADAMMNPQRHRVVRQPLPRQRGDQVYFIHDNGSRPFVAVVGSRRVRVYAVPREAYVWQEDWSDREEDNLDLYSALVLDLRAPVRVFIGGEEGEESTFRGNSLLVAESALRYVYLGAQIYRFTTSEPIEHYYSHVGNSDVPYPVAVSQSRLYFMLDRVSVAQHELGVPRSEWADAYRYFYDQKVKTTLPLADCHVLDAGQRP